MPFPLVLPGTNVRPLAGGWIHSGLYLQGIVSRYMSSGAGQRDYTIQGEGRGQGVRVSSSHSRGWGSRLNNIFFFCVALSDPSGLSSVALCHLSCTPYSTTAIMMVLLHEAGQVDGCGGRSGTGRPNANDVDEVMHERFPGKGRGLPISRGALIPEPCPDCRRPKE